MSPRVGHSFAAPINLSIRLIKRMRIYHFLNKKHGLNAVQNARLKVGRINELNDPFEHAHLNTDNYVIRQVVKGRKNSANRLHGIICFSKNYSSPVQWAHYADSHKGLCLGFDVPSEDLIEIEYLDERGAEKEFKSLLDYNREEFIRYMLSKKHKHWTYEEEVRLLVNFGKRKKDDSLVFKEFSNEMKLVEVIMGFRSRLRKKDIKESLSVNGQNIEISLVAPSKTKYEMEKVV